MPPREKGSVGGSSGSDLGDGSVGGGGDGVWDEDDDRAGLLGRALGSSVGSTIGTLESSGKRAESDAFFPILISRTVQPLQALIW
jgi:hypothetical protein